MIRAKRRYFAIHLAIAAVQGNTALPGLAQSRPDAIQPAPALPTVTYADIADLVDASAVVALVEVRSQALVPPVRAPGLAAGHARLYLDSRTEAILWGRSAMGGQVTFLADVPLLPNGKPPKLKKRKLLLFADPVAGRPGSVQLVAPDAAITATPENQQLTRSVIAAFAAPEVEPRLAGIRDVMSVAGNLTGESETQVFLNTQGGAPVSMTVVRRPGMEPQWGVSWSEVVDQSARPPQRDTVAWYRLACFLPASIPEAAYLQRETAARNQASADYRLVMQQLGSCPRTRPITH
jgi:hypothetical protein